jgi:leader peptidase (prepilin peptidase)/N-methyltransferase
VSAPLAWALTGSVVCGLAGLAVPWLIRRLPEPSDPAADKIAYVDLARRPRLQVWAVLWATLAGAVVGWSLPGDSMLLLWWPLVPVGVALGLIDWETRLLPTRLIAPSYAFVVAALAVIWLLERDAESVVRAGLGWLIAGGFYLLLWLIHPRGLGYGDVRLSGVLGLALGSVGWAALVVGVYAGFFVGGVLGLLLTLTRRVDRSGYPFGPFMLVGALLGVVWGEPLAGLVWG